MAKDIHIIRYFSSSITVSNGRVIKITRPSITYCPVAGFLYQGLRKSAGLSPSRLKDEIKKIIERKIASFGFCSKDRVLWAPGRSVPFGASEILSHALKNKIIGSAVTVCDGAGTVIAPVPEVVQGIGARMHSIFRTSAIPEVIGRLGRYGCRTINDDGTIDQRKGIIEAARLGYKKIAVTINGYSGENLKKIRALEGRYGISVTILVICTTGINKARIDEIGKYADIVWACRSEEIRNKLSKKAIKTLSGASPVYILTEKGSGLVSGYSPDIFTLRKEAERSQAL